MPGPPKRGKKSPDTNSPKSGSQSLFSPKVLDAVPDAMIAVDGEGKILHVNAQTEVMFGYPREELIGQPIEMLVPERIATVITDIAQITPNSLRFGEWEPDSTYTEGAAMVPSSR